MSDFQGTPLDAARAAAQKALARGTEALQRHDAGAAVTHLEHAVELDAACGDAWYNLGVAREGTGDAAGAAKAYVEAVRLEPGAADARLNLAGALQRARAPAPAVEAECRRAFELDAALARRRATRLSRFRPPPWDRPWARAVERLWDALKAADYGRAAIRARVRRAAGTTLHRSHPSGRDWHELRLSLSTAALDDLETDALGTLIACFLIGVAVGEAALSTALGGADSVAQLRRAGVLVDVDNKNCRRCCGALQLFPILDSDVIATDWSSETLLEAKDAVMSVGTESLELVVLAPPPRLGARVLDLCCGSGIQGVVALCRGAASVTFVDSSRRALALCRVNVLGCERRGRLGDARFLRCDARHARDVALRAGGRAFDMVLANPPFVAGGSSRFAAAGDDGCRVLEPLVRSLAAHVAPRGGYACVASEFYERREGLVPPCPGLDALLLRDPRHAEAPADYTAGRGLSAAVADGLARRGVVSVCSGLLVLRPVHALRTTSQVVDIADGAADADALALESFLERPAALTRAAREALRFVWRDPDDDETVPS